MASLFLASVFSASPGAKAADDGFSISISNAVNEEKVMTIEVLINNNSKVKMIDVPVSGRLEVYSILGVKVTTIALSASTKQYTIPNTLPKGVYILKAGNVAQKIIAR